MTSIRLALLAAAASLPLMGAAAAQPVPSTADVAKQRAQKFRPRTRVVQAAQSAARQSTQSATGARSG